MKDSDMLILGGALLLFLSQGSTGAGGSGGGGLGGTSSAGTAGAAASSAIKPAIGPYSRINTPAPAGTSQIQGGVTDILGTIADSLNRSFGANVYIPTTNSINISPNLPAASLPVAQSVLDIAVISSGAAAVINPYSQMGGGVGSGLTSNLATFANMGSTAPAVSTPASSNWSALAAGGTYNPNTGTVTPAKPAAASLASTYSTAQRSALGLM